MRSLRLLVTKKCLLHCKYCSNQYIQPTTIFDLEYIHIYSAIIITGGEPLLFPENLLKLIHNIRSVNFNIPIYLYTSIFNPSTVNKNILTLISGITFTVHNRICFNEFQDLKKFLDEVPLEPYSKRLHIFTDFGELTEVNLYGWNVRFVAWKKDFECKLPENEQFMKLNELWK